MSADLQRMKGATGHHAMVLLPDVGPKGPELPFGVGAYWREQGAVGGGRR